MSSVIKRPGFHIYVIIYVGIHSHAKFYGFVIDGN